MRAQILTTLERKRTQVVINPLVNKKEPIALCIITSPAQESKVTLRQRRPRIRVNQNEFVEGESTERPARKIRALK